MLHMLKAKYIIKFFKDFSGCLISTFIPTIIATIISRQTKYTNLTWQLQ